MLTRSSLTCCCLVATFVWLPPTIAQDDIKELKLRAWKPRSMLKTRATRVDKPAFPVIDVHNHLGRGASRLTPERVRQYLEEMDAAGVRTVVNLDGGWGTELKETLAQRNRVIAKHPETTFICAHFANNPEDIETVGQWLDRYPNMYVDIDARISELGRQPYSIRRFLIKYQDRVLFGTDTRPRRDSFRMYYRFLETDDEYFDPAGGHHVQGFWMIYGVFLPRVVLAKIYHRNAERLLHGLTR